MRTRVRWLRWAFPLLIALLVGAFAWDYEVQKNFSVVVPGKIYRSGQPREAQLEAWIQKYGLNSILSLRHGLPPYERELAERYGVKIHNVTFSAGSGLKEGQWEAVLPILTDESNLPILIHCRGGGDRSGIVTALYRVEVQGWPLDKAIREMKHHYHVPLRYPALQKHLREKFREDPEGGFAPQTE